MLSAIYTFLTHFHWHLIAVCTWNAHSSPARTKKRVTNVQHYYVNDECLSAALLMMMMEWPQKVTRAYRAREKEKVTESVPQAYDVTCHFTFCYPEKAIREFFCLSFLNRRAFAPTNLERWFINSEGVSMFLHLHLSARLTEPFVTGICNLFILFASGIKIN